MQCADDSLRLDPSVQTLKIIKHIVTYRDMILDLHQILHHLITVTFSRLSYREVHLFEVTSVKSIGLQRFGKIRVKFKFFFKGTSFFRGANQFTFEKINMFLLR